MFGKDPRKYNPNALSDYLERSNRFNYPRQHVGDFKYYRYPAVADTAFFPYLMIVLGVIACAWILIWQGLDFNWRNLLSESPILVFAVIFIIGGILKLRARRKRERHD
jgi:hypothetical protein